MAGLPADSQLVPLSLTVTPGDGLTPTVPIIPHPVLLLPELFAMAVSQPAASSWRPSMAVIGLRQSDFEFSDL